MDSSFNHFLVPKPFKMSEKELSELLSNLSITVNQLPKVKLDDASLKGLDAVEGDVIKYVRDSQVTKKQENYYRVVVSD